MSRSLQMKCNIFMWKHVIWYFPSPPQVPSGNKFLESHVTSSNQGLCRSSRGGIKTLACEVGPFHDLHGNLIMDAAPIDKTNTFFTVPIVSFAHLRSSWNDLLCLYVCPSSAGVSRSATVILAYMMYSQNISLEQALRDLKAIYPKAEYVILTLWVAMLPDAPYVIILLCLFNK